MKKAIFLSLLALSTTSFARFEWPNANPEHGLCGIAGNYTCEEGFICDMKVASSRGFGICRQGCECNADCEPGQVCALHEDFPVCVDQE